MPASLSLLLRYQWSCFFFFFGSAHGMQDLSSLPRDWTHAWKRGVFTTGSSGESWQLLLAGTLACSIQITPKVPVTCTWGIRRFSKQKGRPTPWKVPLCSPSLRPPQSMVISTSNIFYCAICYFHFRIHYEHLFMYFNLYKDCITIL